MFEKSVALFERSKKVAPGGVHSPVRAFHAVGGTPIFMQKGQGAKLTDADGNVFTDYCMSWGALAVRSTYRYFVLLAAALSHLFL